MSEAAGPDSSIGIVSWGTYLPAWRLPRAAIGSTLGGRGASGTRSAASYDEDTTTMAAEATRLAIASLADPAISDLYFSTPEPAYLDKTNAAAVHAAAGLADTAGAYDLVGSSRSSVAAFRTALATASSDRQTIAVTSDLRTGLPGSADELAGGDGACALVFGVDPIATVVAHASATEEFLDRWRTPGDERSSQWEERFGEEVYVPLARKATADALAAAGVDIADVDHVVVSGLHARAVKAATRATKAGPDVIAGDLAGSVGNTGAAHPWIVLGDVLDRASAGQTVLVLVLADGADALVLRTTAKLGETVAARRAAGTLTVAEQIQVAGDVDYPRYLTWRGYLPREGPRRPDPERPGAPSTWRSSGWRGGFESSTCRKCGFRHLPPTRVCLECHAVDQMDRERISDVRGRIATWTIDRLAYSPSPPVLGVVVDFEGGGRYRCLLTDAEPDSVTIGQEVEMVFRRFYTAQGGVHNYFWKARPVRGARPSGGERERATKSNDDGKGA